MDEERIKVVVHHTGHFVSDDNENLKFDGERVKWSCDPELWNYFGIVASIKDLGHMDVKELWYRLGGLSVDPDRLELLTDDRGAMHMLNLTRLNDEVHLYVVHNTMEPEIIETIDWVGDVATQVEEGEVIGDGEVQREMVEGESDGEVHTEVRTEMVEGEGEGLIQVRIEMRYGDGHTEVGTKMVDGQCDAHDSEEAEVHEVEEDAEVHHVEETEVHDFELEDLGEDDDVDGSEGEDVHEAQIEDADVDDDEEVDDHIDASEESVIDVSIQCEIGTSKGNVRQDPSTPEDECSWSIDNECIDDVRGLFDNEWLSEELINGPDSGDDDDSTKIRFPTFSIPKSLKAYKWELGTYFVEKKKFTDVIRTYALSNGRSLKFIKNVKKKLRKVFDAHNCSRDFNVKLMTSKWLSERMEKTVRENPTMKVMDIREKLTKKWMARDMAKDNIEGSFKEQFRIIYDYGHELLRTNPGSTDNFISCRPIIGLDGCFLKGKYGGDGNEQMLPIAYAIVEVENKDLWTWFLELLIEDFAIYPQQWEAEMRNIKDINLEAFKYLIAIPPRRTTPKEQQQDIPSLAVFVNYEQSSKFPERSTSSSCNHNRAATIFTRLREVDDHVSSTPQFAHNLARQATIQERSPRVGTKKKCGVCKELGHNKKGCPQRPPTVEVPTAQSTEQTKVTQPPLGNAPITQESTMLPTVQCHEQPQPTQPPTTDVLITQESTMCVSDE
ncbi:hypothetical protein V8G54_036217 [Vigna mungo]|uniref:PB1-like domain-containing protein n=1 Tax=Vigna mungo TaxID=3915 RepID=A0AAQ3RF89_VIGMU